MGITGSTDIGNGLLTLTVDHDPTSVATDAPAGSIIIDSNAKRWKKLDDGSTTNVEPMDVGVDLTVTQAGHGFSDPSSSVTVIRHNGSSWVKAQADSAANAESCWVVTKVISANIFIAKKVGNVDITGWGLSAGTVYFLDPDTAGAITSSKTTTVGEVQLAVITAHTTTEGEILDMPPLLLSGHVSSTLNHTIWVAKNGNDGSGTGDITAPYLTIKYALSTITDNDASNRYTVFVCPGVYTEDNPIAMKSYVDVVAVSGANTVNIVASNTGSNLIVGATVSEINGFVLSGTATAALVYMATANGAFVCRKITFVDAQTGVLMNQATASGVVCYACVGWTTPITGSITTLFSCTAGSLVAWDTYIVLDADIDTIAKADGANANVSFAGFSSTSTNVVNGLHVLNGGTIQVTAARILNATYGIRIGSGGGNVTGDNTWIESDTYDLWTENGGAVVHGNSLNLSRDKLNLYDYENIYFFGHDDFTHSFRVVQNMQVGQDGVGNKLNVGEGGQYLYHTKIKTYNGSTYADIDNGDPISFPNTSVNTAIYFGDTEPIPFYGLGYLMGATPINLGSGAIVWEYYDGGTSSWLAFDTLNTLSDHSDTQAGASFTGSNNKRYTVRLDQDVEPGTGVSESSSSATGWTTTTVDGDSGYWVRCRISSAITTSPVFSYPRMKGNYSEFRTNGTRAFHGEARGATRAVADQGVNRGSALDEPLSVSANIDFAFAENELANGSTDILYFKILITEEMDTSCGIKVIFELCTEQSPSGADETAKLHFYSAHMKEGGTFDGTAGEVEQAFDFVASDGDDAYLSQRITMVDRVDISTLVPGDVVYAILKRLSSESGDDLDGDVFLSNLFYEYRSWQQGSNYE